MFDIGFTEIALIGVVSLLVVGPERLPGMVRTVGVWVGRMRRYVSHVRADIERELHAEELRDLVRRPAELDGLKQIGNDLREAIHETKSAFTDTANSIDAAGQDLRDDLTDGSSDTQAADGDDADADGTDTDGTDTDGTVPAAGTSDAAAIRPAAQVLQAADAGGDVSSTQTVLQDAISQDGGPDPQRELDLFDAGDAVSGRAPGA